ncbi:MFS transporter [Pseudolactococcus plantarum]|nr:MFS transporter [Lactococcus plantarum]HCN74072.1 MFS transporter [Lactococcus sp.]
MSKRLTISAIVLLNFIIYISLGLPDSILGSAWPSMRQSYGMAADQVSYLTTIMLLFSFLSSMLYTKISKYLTVAKVIVISMVFVIIGLILMMITSNPVILFLTTPFLGIGQGAIDVTVNHFAAKHLPSALMSLLHGFYGLGVSLSAAILTFFLSTFASWRLAILAIAVIEVLILLLIVIYRDQFAERDTSHQANKATDALSRDSRFNLRHLLHPIFYFFYAIEGIVGIYMATYYVENFHVKPAQAAFYTTLFWLGLMFGRFLTGALTRVLSDKKILCAHLVLLLIMSALLGLPPSAYTSLMIFIFGLSLSPLYPLMMMLPNQLYPEIIAKRVISYNVGFCLLGILVFPLIFGEVFNQVGFAIFPILILGIALILLGLALLIFNQKTVDK